VQDGVDRVAASSGHDRPVLAGDEARWGASNRP